MVPTVLVVDDNKELVALLTSLFEEAGYAVVGASKGRAAIDAAKDKACQVAVLDVLLPDMMGYNVAEALRAQVPGLPVIFMSGVFKGSRHSAEALGRFPGAKYFEKPFDAKQLLAVIGQFAPPPPLTLTPPPPPSGSAHMPPPLPPDFDVELDIDVDEAEEQEAMELTGKIRVTGGGNITAALEGEALTMQKAASGPVSGTRPVASTMSGVVRIPKGVRPSHQGQLNDNLPGLISAFYLSKETGELYCQRGKVKKVVYFESGQPVFALSNLAADRFGQFLVRVGKIRPEQLQDAAVIAAATKRRTGDVLVERGLLQDTERLFFVGQQVRAIIYSLFAWEDGQYVMTFHERARAESIKLDVFPGNFIVRGVKKLYKPARLERLVRSDDRLMPSPQPAYQLHELELEKWEAMLLPHLDGTRTNSEIIALAKRPDAQVRAFLAAMLAVQILEKREM